MDKSNPVGKKFNKLTVIAFSHSDPLQHKMWKCQCECGNEKVLATRQLGKTQSCGCVRNTKHKAGEFPIRLYSMMHNSAKRRGLNFDIPVSNLWELFLSQNKKCALTGLAIDFGVGPTGKDRTASLDRIDSTKDYVCGNVQWVHRRVNVMKQDMSKEELIYLCGLIFKNFTDTEMKHTNQLPVEQKSAGGSPVVSAINYYRRKRPKPRNVSVKKKLETGLIPNISEEQEREIITLRKDGYTIRAISAKTNIHRGRITYCLQKHNLPTNKWKGLKKFPSPTMETTEISRLA